jgi:hypothetical protein
MSKGIRLLVVLSDLHAGSTLSLCPPDFATLEGNTVQPNAVQRWLWSCWRNLNDEWLPSVIGGEIGKDPFALVLNGDLREGIHHGTKQVISPDPADHDAAAVQLLKPLADRAKMTLVTLGTESHTGSSAEHSIARQLGATRPPGAVGNVWAWDTVNMRVGGVRCVFRHHVSTSARMYLRGSALSIHLGNEQLEAANNGEEIPRVVGWGHRHTWDLYQRHDSLAFTTPAWQVLTRFANKVVASARPQPGAVVLDWRDREDGQLPAVHVKTYRMQTVDPLAI